MLYSINFPVLFRKVNAKYQDILKNKLKNFYISDNKDKNLRNQFAVFL